MCLINVRDEEEYSPPARVRRRSPERVRVVRQSIVRQSETDFGPLPPGIPRASKPDIPPASEAPTRRTSRPPSRAPSARSRTRSAYVEVDEETSSSSESSISRHTRKTSKSRRTAPASEYSVHEREVRRERGYSRPRDEYETYRYVEAPKSRAGAARSDYYEPSRTGRDGRRSENIEVDIRRSTRDYR